MNIKLAQAAIAAITDPSIESRKGFCSRYVRQVTEQLYEDRFAYLFGYSAIDTGHRFKSRSLTVDPGISLEPGDYLFKMRGSGGFGHVGIYVDTHRVAENSSTSVGRVSGAKGFRSLEQYGSYDLVGRIPGGTATSWCLFINHKFVTYMPLRDSGSWCPIRAWATALGLEVSWDEEAHQVLIEGEPLDVLIQIIDDHAYAPIRELVKSAGLQLEVLDQAKTVMVSRGN